jgi:hypothetical protein
MKRWLLASIALACVAADPAVKVYKPVHCDHITWRTDVGFVSGPAIQAAENRRAKAELRTPEVAPPNGAVHVFFARTNIDAAAGDHVTIAFGDAANVATLDRRPQNRVVPDRDAGEGWWYRTFDEIPPTSPPFDVHIMDALSNTRCDVHIDADGKAKRLRLKL